MNHCTQIQTVIASIMKLQINLSSIYRESNQVNLEELSSSVGHSVLVLSIMINVDGDNIIECKNHNDDDKEDNELMIIK